MVDGKARQFGGPLGNLVLIAGLPIFTAYLFFAVRHNGGELWPQPSSKWSEVGADLVPTGRSVALYAGWLLAQVVLQHFGPGRQVFGEPLPDGRRLPYRMNGLFALVVTFVGVAALHVGGIVSIGIWYEEFGPLLTVSTIVAFVFSIFLYAYGQRCEPGAIRSKNLIYDFWMGTARNPRVPNRPEGFDLKLFCEARPGLLLWVLVNLSFAYTQWERHGFVSGPMMLVVVFQFIYVADYFWHEDAILTTMDIKHERFGFMLAFGDLVWVPMTYSLQAHYLVEHAHDLPWWGTAGIIVVNMTGFLIFRSVNLQKHKFRADPDGTVIWGRKAEYIRTSQGTPLLVSGFWGWSRHFNYVGDLLMALSWSLPCLFASVLPYFYPIYFAALLVHRERRDHAICESKYGEDWATYCERVPYRIVPGVY